MTIKQYLASKLLHFTWNLAFMEYDESLYVKETRHPRYNVINNPYRSKWFADPFILYASADKINLLVEEFDKNVGRGRIAKLTIDKKNNTIIDCKIILDIPTHLSFPVIYKIHDEIYVHPENSALGKSLIYKYNTESDKLEEYRVLVDEPLTDAVIYHANDIYYIFATKLPNPNGNELFTYKSDAMTNIYHPYKNYTFDSNFARTAGTIQIKGDKIIRAAQDCNGDYGKGLIFQEVIFDRNDIFFKKCGSLYPNSIKYAGIHTINSFNQDFFVIDLKLYDYPLLYWLKTRIQKIFK